MIERTSLPQQQGRRPDPVQPWTRPTQGEQANGTAIANLDLTKAGGLLREHGYELICRFGHVHASLGEQEWHICLVVDLSAMTPSHLLVCLEEAIRLSLEIERVR